MIEKNVVPIAAVCQRTCIFARKIYTTAFLKDFHKKKQYKRGPSQFSFQMAFCLASEHSALLFTKDLQIYRYQNHKKRCGGPDQIAGSAI